MNQKKRLFFLDAARGAAILLVVLGHIWETDDVIPVLIYSFHVPLFFIISGILLNYTESAKRSWKQILTARLTGLIIPYLFYETVFVLIFGLRSHFDFSSLQANAWDGLLMKPLNVPLWFLICLFFSELILILLLKLIRKNWLVGCICFLLYIIPFFIKNPEFPADLLLKICSSMGFLALGYFSAGIIQNASLPVYVILPALAVSAVAAYYNEKTGINKLTFHNPALFTFCAVTGSYSVLFLLKKIRIRILELAGRNTLPILGLHIIVLRILQQILGLNTDSIAGGFAALAAICLLLAPVCVLINRFFPFMAGKPLQKISK